MIGKAPKLLEAPCDAGAICFKAARKPKLETPVKMSIPLRCVITVGVLFGAMSEPCLASTTSLNVQVANVIKEVCTGDSQSTCTTSSAPGFIESLSFDDIALSSDNVGTGAGVYASEATYGFPFASSGNPYTAELQAILTQTPTFTTAFTSLSASFASGSGAAFGQIYADQSYDDGNGGTGDFQQNYAMSAALTQIGAYQDLTTTSAHDFLSALLEKATGSYTAFGTSQVFDGGLLVSGSYAFTQYTGDLTLIAAVPEPTSLALFSAGLAAMALRSIRKSRAAAVHA